MDYDISYWKAELARYEKEAKKFGEQGKKIVKRYKDERGDSESTEARFNILWSNIRTLKPAIYSRPPKVEVSRRFKDQNDIARVATQMLERVIDFEIEHYSDYNSTMSSVVDDRLLPGRGTAWIRYEPITETVDAEPEITEDVEIGGEDYTESDEGLESQKNAIAGDEVEQYERIANETCPVDYVHWQDFACTPARTWEEVTWVARRVYLGRDEGVDRFGKAFELVPLKATADSKGVDDNIKQPVIKAEVWEIWCKTSEKVYWIARGYDKLLDERDDPLELEGFFPCPKPLFATISTDSIIPVADFILYQDQADEIDEITSRIRHLTKALKVMGVYAQSEDALSRLFKEGNDAVLIPVENWPAFNEAGGIQGAIQLVPLNNIIQALQQLYQARESCKQIIYETTGLSDILRGASLAAETATAQQIKSQFASIRLNDMKDDVARFARDLLRMKAQIICSKYQPETIIKVSGIENTPDAQFALQALDLLKNEPLRNFHIDIETDTLVQMDEQADKQSRAEFLNASSQYLNSAMQLGAQTPEIAPLLLSLLLFGVRGFKIGRELEGEFEKASVVLQQKAQMLVAHQQQQMANPQPNPDQMRVQADIQKAQADLQASLQKAQAELQADIQKHQSELQSDMQKHQMSLQHEAALKQQEQALQAQLEREKMGIQLEIARISKMATAETAQMTVQDVQTIAGGL